MFWKFLRLLFGTYVLFYFRKFKGKNLSVIRTDAPVLIAMTHPNAFIDSIAFSCVLFNPRTYYMARGDAFKKGFINYILRTTGIVPIFRLRDGGIEGVKKNNESFSIVYKMWNKGKKIIVFPEGLCIQERRLRPIQKGTARMAFGFTEETKRDDFLIVPVNITYSHPSKFGSDVFYEAGNPIPIKKYLSTYEESPAKAVNDLTKDLENELKKITPHLNDKENDRLLEQLQFIYKEEYLEKNGYNKRDLEQHQNFWFFITSRLNQLTSESPLKIEELKHKVSAYMQKLNEYHLSDKSVYGFQKTGAATFASSLLFMIIGSPVYVIAKLIHFLPKFLAEKTAQKTCKNIEFYASVNFVTGAFYSLFYLILECILLWTIFQTMNALVIYLIIKLVIVKLGLEYSRKLPIFLSEVKFYRLQRTQKNVITNLSAMRKEITEILI